MWSEFSLVTGELIASHTDLPARRNANPLSVFRYEYISGMRPYDAEKYEWVALKCGGIYIFLTRNPTTMKCIRDTLVNPYG